VKYVLLVNRALKFCGVNRAPHIMLSKARARIVHMPSQEVQTHLGWV